MKIQELKVWIKRQLGEDEDCCSVSVELSDKQLEQAARNAIYWFTAFVGLFREAQFTLQTGVNEYDLSGVTPRVGDVVNAWFPLPAGRIDFNVLYPGFLDINGIPLGLGGSDGMGAWGGGSYPQTSIVQTIQTLSSTEKILSSDLDWEFYRDSTVEPNIRVMRVMPAPTSQVGPCIYKYSIDPLDIKLNWYGAKYLHFLRQWAFADAKYILGRKRGKFQSLPTAGGERTMDGESLISESREEKAEIEEKILEIQGPPMPMLY